MYDDTKEFDLRYWVTHIGIRKNKDGNINRLLTKKTNDTPPKNTDDEEWI